MKKKFVLLVIVTGLFYAQSSLAMRAQGHLDWDSLDAVWRCVGSALDCAF